MKRMKKLLSLLAAATITAASVTSCLENDDNSGNSDSTATGYITSAYLVNAGSWGTIDGTLSKITGTYTTSSSTSSTTAASLNFTASTIGSVGDTGNDILIYGNKMYVVVTGENAVRVYDKNSLSLLQSIDTQSLMGGTAGCQPRHIAAANNLIYVSTYGVEAGTAYTADSKGYVAAIDTVNFALQTKYEVGPYPEDLVAASVGSSTTNYYVFVTNSDYGQGNGSISTITINNGTGTVSTSTFSGIKNPVQIEVGGSYLWIQDMATYDSNYAKVTDDAIWAWGGSTSSTPTKVIEGAAMMAPLTLTTYGGSSDARIYFVKDPYGTPSYGYYSVLSGSTTSLDLSGIAQPCAIGADPYTGYIYVASLAAKGDYNSSGYVNIYKYSDGSLIKSQLGAGINPTAFAFDFKYIYKTSSIYTSQY